MIKLDNIPKEYATYLKGIAEDIKDDSGLDNLKIIKKVMNLSFGEDNNQIIPPTMEGILDELYRNGYNERWINDRFTRIDSLKSAIRSMGIDQFAVVILFPEITIKNSKKATHIIKDLYVRFHVDRSGKFVGSLMGARGTVTMDEYNAGYSHSHLPRGSMDLWQNFCTGTGEINQVRALLAQSFDEINFTLFCLHLKNYVAWESLEGTPYHHISNINLSEAEVPLSADHASKASGRLIEKMFCVPGTDSWIKTKINLRVTPNRISVEATEGFETWAANVFLSDEKIARDIGINVSDAISLKNTSGRYFSSGRSNRRNLPSSRTPFLKFKGKDIFLKVTSEKNETPNIKYINSKITQEFCRELSTKFSKAAIDAKGFEIKEDPIGDSSEVAESDFLSVL